MTSNKFQKSPRWLRQVIPYTLIFGLVILAVFFGSRDKANISSGSLSMSSITDSDYQVSTDQLSEMYTVANLSDSMRLASADTVSNNYVIVTVLHDIGQSDFDKLEKPNIVDTNVSRGAQTHIVAAGETMFSIAKRFGITVDQIRWSNGLKSADVAPGQSLFIPMVPGIVYIVKAGDDLQTVAARYGSSASSIIKHNDLESSATLSAGMRIVLPGGSLPPTERPEYVAPRSSRRSIYTYTYAGSSSVRQNVRVISDRLQRTGDNPMVGGQCTWYAWQWRKNHGMALPGGGTLGNARHWAVAAARAGYVVNRTPAYGAVFQTTAGYYGHVGIVTAVHGDGSITVREMNYAGAYVVTESEIPASAVGSFLYIH